MALGRRNWLFADTVSGAKASAHLYSLVQTARANELEPYAYLRRLFTELPAAQTVEQIEALLPWKSSNRRVGKIERLPSADLDEWLLRRHQLALYEARLPDKRVGSRSMRQNGRRARVCAAASPNTTGQLLTVTRVAVKLPVIVTSFVVSSNSWPAVTEAR